MVPGEAALLLEGGRRLLVASDLHIGLEGPSAPAGVRVRGAGARLPRLAARLGADAVVLLGDTKSSVSGISRAEWDQVPAFLGDLARVCEVVIVPGNHDAGIERLAPGGVTVTAAAGLEEDGTLMTHGHALPPPSFAGADRIVMGHAHPSYSGGGSVMDGQRVWVSVIADRGSIFPGRTGDVEVVMVPAFGGHMGGAPGVQRRGAPRSPIARRMEVRRARIVALDGSVIGDESDLGSVL